MNKDDVRKRLQKEIKRTKTQKAFADKAGITPQYVSDMVNGRRDFSDRVLEILGLQVDYIEKRN